MEDQVKTYWALWFAAGLADGMAPAIAARMAWRMLDAELERQCEGFDPFELLVALKLAAPAVARHDLGALS